MYIVIGGGGKIGSFLAQSLSSKKHRVVVIEKDEEKAKYLSETLQNVVVIVGDTSDVITLSQIDLDNADRFIAATGRDEDNLVACGLVKTLFKVPITIARINDPRNEKVARAFNVDITINVTEFLVKMAEEGIIYSDLIPLIAIGKGNFIIVEVKIDEHSKVVNKQIKDLNLPEGALIVTIVRDSNLILPSGKESILNGDHLVLLVKPEVESELREILNHERKN
ncbi:MAG: potassium channel family protein [Caldisericum exile]|uniref:potassium channel family protein n=1 Tax=Caldisericum exile TaxID=693075 RepID=UPI003C781FB8